MKAAAIMLAAVVCAGTSAYAAAKYFGVLDFLRDLGMKQTEEPQKLLKSETKALEFSNDYVDYTIKEALCDSELIYMVIEGRPKENDGYLLVPQYCTEDDSVAELRMEGVTEGTIGAYAASAGKKALYSSVGLFKDGELVSCTEDIRGTEDGSVYYCITGTNGFGTETVDLTCMGTAYTPEMSVANRVEFEYTLTDSSMGEGRTYLPKDAVPAENTVLDRVDIFETELGMYVTYNYHVPDDRSESSFVFELVDENGKELDAMPYYSGSGISPYDKDSGEAGYTMTAAYQKTDLQDEISVKVRDLETDTEYGPFVMEAEESEK